MPHHINITAQNQKLGTPVFKGIPSFVYYSNSRPSVSDINKYCCIFGIIAKSKPLQNNKIKNKNAKKMQ